jgi:peptidyl-prolyl cis-trans isomerase C
MPAQVSALTRISRELLSPRAESVQTKRRVGVLESALAGAVLHFEKSFLTGEIPSPMSFSRSLACSILFILWIALGHAQNPAPAESAAKGYSPDDVVAVILGKEYTAREIEWLRQNMPPELLKQTSSMNYRAFLESLAMQFALAKRGEEMQLAEKEPYRTRLDINERIFLANAFLSEIQQVLNLTQEDHREFYEKHKSDYEELRVSAIYIDYALDPEKAAPKNGKQPLGDKEAWVKVEQLLVELRQGADFAELARKNSDDPAAAEKGGDLGYYKKDSRMPEALKTAIFALKEGEVSAPVKHGGRYYIFKVTERRTQSYTDALPNLLQRIQDVKIREKLDQIRAETQLEIKNEAFAASKPTAGPPAGSAGTAAPARNQ